jgi:hypothetical protein
MDVMAIHVYLIRTGSSVGCPKRRDDGEGGSFTT